MKSIDSASRRGRQFCVLGLALLAMLMCALSFTVVGARSTAEAQELSIAPFAETGWTVNGTCEWKVDGSGTMTVRPADGKYGSLDSLPWEGRTDLVKIVFEGAIDCGRQLNFRFLSSLQEVIGLANLDLTNTQNLDQMFVSCASLTSVDFTGFDTSGITSMSGMFAGCSSLTTLDLSGFDTSGVGYMSYMFQGCSSLVSLNLSGFDTSNVVSMASMFHNCSSLASVDVSGFDTSSTTNMSDMFSGCSNLKTLDVSGFDTSSVTDMDGMFFRLLSISSLDVSGFDTSSVSNFDSMFTGCSKLENLDVSRFDTGSAVNMRNMFDGCKSLKVLDVSKWDTSKVTDMDNLFVDCSNLKELDVSHFDTSNVTDMWVMFMRCSGLTHLDVSGFDTSKVTDMSGMFGGCSGLTDLDVSGFDTSNVTNMWMMFEGCSGLTHLDVSGFDTSNVTNMRYMFGGCSSLKRLDVSRFDTSKVTKMAVMFQGCSSLEALDLSSFDTTHVESWDDYMVQSVDYHEILGGCSSLSTIKTGTKLTLPNLFPDGVWRNEAGAKFTWNAVPVGVADTYTKVGDSPASPKPAPTSLSKVTVKLGKSSLVYNAKSQKPSVTLTWKGKVLKQGTDYTVTYKNNKNIGTGKILIAGKGAYSGSRTVQFKILPQPVALSKVKAAKKSCTVSWKPTSTIKKTVTGYQVRLSTDKSMKKAQTVTVKKATKSSVKVSSLKSGKTYYIQVRTYKKVGGTNYYSSWSKAKSVKVK
ncbi:BspA family leucine-rich repeat surface protein [Adlercreutzia equolifaciens]|uniref:BspA family leucine-rich repeat surface protein n=1 Tax=Adlercreutzia equolifaciens TaxID=446660 RepID=UPI0023AEE5B8|nr:BspA family leucine-rich repeat surface protein [Adlercreutzia equolifaciens]MDE8703057.1 BspA family leucine-rich repeat surface protein [Adlercreutzia equolifaciens]